VRISLTISDSDVSDVEVGQSGIASFDAIENGMLPIVIESIGTNPTTTQGVVTYQAWASIRTERPAGAAGATPSAGGRERLAAVATDAKPLPGMNASLTIIVDQAQDVLTIPAHAIQSEGGNSVVEVQKEDGTTERVVVETGLTDGKNTEIVNGLEEGQTVVIPSTAGSAQSTQDTGTPFPGSRFPGGAPPGGGAP
jgi:HlyD family secretion protein